MKSKFPVLTFIFSCIIATSAIGQVGFTLGTEYGFGVIAQAGTPEAKIEMGGGFSPLLVFWTIDYPYGGNKNYIKFYIPATFGAKLNIALRNAGQDDRLGLKLGASYNMIMKAGYGGGLDYEVAGGAHKFVISAGFMIYPDASDELLNRLNEEESANFTKDEVSAALMSFQPFLSLSIYFGK